jgi:hypothetical protein
MSAVYARIACPCLNERDEDRTFEVIVRFANDDELTLELDYSFDNVYETLAKGIPEGWSPDDTPELVNMVAEDSAKESGFVVYS